MKISIDKMSNASPLRLSDAGKAFFAMLFLRLGCIVATLFAAPLRHTVPHWMAESFFNVSYPLLYCNLVFIIFYKKLSLFLHKYPFALFIDLSLTLGLLLIGGGWRSSYFGYTLTSIIIFTIFDGRRGAYISAAILSAGALIKDPAGGLPFAQEFDFSNWDMRIGAAAAYVLCALITGYFSILLHRLQKLSEAKVEETRKLAAMEEKTRMLLALHDGAKQIVTAMLLKMNPLMKSMQSSQNEIAEELRWLWRGVHHLKNELDQVMDAIKNGDRESSSRCNIVAFIEEEARLSKIMTGFSWQLSAEPSEIYIALPSKLPLRRFLNEAFLNAWKHSGETTGTINLRSFERSTIVCIADKGKGFDASERFAIKNTGLLSLNYRARELNAGLDIETAPGMGCKVILTIPISRSNLD
jgi:signal transduction histidine kinase